jgi:acylphosphatase
VLVRGDDEAVQALIAWLSQGPPAAQVAHVEVATVSEQELMQVPSGFTTR